MKGSESNDAVLRFDDQSRPAPEPKIVERPATLEAIREQVGQLDNQRHTSVSIEISVEGSVRSMNIHGGPSIGYACSCTVTSNRDVEEWWLVCPSGQRQTAQIRIHGTNTPFEPNLVTSIKVVTRVAEHFLQSGGERHPAQNWHQTI